MNIRRNKLWAVRICLNNFHSYHFAKPPGFSALVSVRSNNISLRKKKVHFTDTVTSKQQTTLAHWRKGGWNRSLSSARNRVNGSVALNKSFSKLVRSWKIHTATHLTYLHGRIHSFLFHFWFNQRKPSLHVSKIFLTGNVLGHTPTHCHQGTPTGNETILKLHNVLAECKTFCGGNHEQDFVWMKEPRLGAKWNNLSLFRFKTWGKKRILINQCMENSRKKFVS